MFNAVSREKLRQVISEQFPELEAFADLLYEEQGHTVIKHSDGSWEWIPVQEGFSQGCPLSPVFVGIVLHHITSKINNILQKRVTKRVRKGNLMDDNKGGVPIIMGYVDDVNTLVPLEDVATYLE